MRNVLSMLTIAAIMSVGYGCSNVGYAGTSTGSEAAPVEEQAPAEEPNEQDEAADLAAITKLAEDFGKQLQLVSLLAPEDEVRKSMEEHYGGLVTPELLAAWQSDPESAPGRTVSSPWPDRIEVKEVAKSTAGDAYTVKGEIVEVTSTEQESEAAAIRSVELTAKKVEGRWLIDAVTLGEYDEEAESSNAGAVAYANADYGFTFALPDSWNGYTIVTGEWEGAATESTGTGEKGPMLSIRHPEWTTEEPRQDIPIMVLTTAQWEKLQAGDFHIGAAPIDPSELGRNSKYVFALPARYNFAFPTGYEEVEDILKDDPLLPTDDFGKSE